MFNGCVYFALTLPQQLLLPSSMFCKVYQNICAVDWCSISSTWSEHCNVFSRPVYEEAVKMKCWSTTSVLSGPGHLTSWTDLSCQSSWGLFIPDVSSLGWESLFLLLYLFKPAALIDCCCVSHQLAGCWSWTLMDRLMVSSCCCFTESLSRLVTDRSVQNQSQCFISTLLLFP